MLVSEPIALALAQAAGGRYLTAQVFTGFMYVGAALCMWFLRAWKIGQLELLAVRTEKPPDSADSSDPVGDQALEAVAWSASGAARAKSNVLKRMCMWKRV